MKDTHRLLAEDTTINFIGNVEGRDVLSGDVDVLVADGFTGNVILKTLEGTLQFLVGEIIAALTSEEAASVGSGSARSSGANSGRNSIRMLWVEQCCLGLMGWPLSAMVQLAHCDFKCMSSG